MSSSAHLLDPIRHHHEQLNGKGYPDGLKDDEIPPIWRILAVADVYDALRGDRPYREAMTEAETFSVSESIAAEGRMEGKVVAHLRNVVRETRARSDQPVS